MNIDRIILAPMEGVLDYHVRQILTEINALDYCVTEFVRITHHKLSNRTFYRLCPELHHGGKTASGTPVRVQILGQSPEWMAENAVKAIELGSHGVDINLAVQLKPSLVVMVAHIYCNIQIKSSILLSKSDRQWEHPKYYPLRFV